MDRVTNVIVVEGSSSLIVSEGQSQRVRLAPRTRKTDVVPNHDGVVVQGEIGEIFPKEVGSMVPAAEGIVAQGHYWGLTGVVAGEVHGVLIVQFLPEKLGLGEESADLAGLVEGSLVIDGVSAGHAAFWGWVKAGADVLLAPAGAEKPLSGSDQKQPYNQSQQQRAETVVLRHHFSVVFF